MSSIPEFSSFLSAMIGGLVVGVFTVWSVKSGQKYDSLMKERERKINEIQQKKQIRSRLRGAEFPTTSHYYMHSTTYILNKYYRAISEIKAIEKSNLTRPNQKLIPLVELDAIKMELPDTIKADREGEKLHELAMNYGIISKELGDIIGYIQVSFENNNKKDELIDKLENVLDRYNRHITSNPSEFEMKDMNEIYKWMGYKTKTVIPDYLSKELGPAFKELLDYLKAEIDRDAEALDKMSDPSNSRCYRICKFFCNP